MSSVDRASGLRHEARVGQGGATSAVCGWAFSGSRRKPRPLPTEMARALLRALDALVDMGDRRASAIQTSEVFKDVRLND